MEINSSTTLSLTQISVPEVTRRRCANYHPTVWGDHFLAYGSTVTEMELEMEQQVEQLKERAREMIMAMADKPSQKLNLIDAIQRLGVGYHFETEIETALLGIYETYLEMASDEDLYSVALSFRLLRQHGYPVSCAVPNTKNSTAPDDVTQRRSANFHPSIWGAHFLSYNSDVTEVDGKVEQQLEQLKERVRNILMEADIPSQKLNLIDAIQRLGVAYHFQTEIEAALEHIYETYDHEHDHKSADREDLYAVALSFRLLRQEGFPVSSDVFNKFKDNKGKFQRSLTDDVRGMLSLYEATHLRVRGEDILDEALDFTTTHLNSALPNLNNPNAIAAQVLHALNQPIRKGLTRLESRHYISFYEQDDTHNKVLLDFAKLDFNLLQKLHQRELSEITKWWKDLDFASKLPFARDRVVECYFWTLGVYFEPQYFLARRILTKVISLTSIIDDIYDVYGTLEELVLFTDAIQRWERSALDQLPEYMKLCYQALMDVYNMIDEEMTREGTSYRLDYAKSAMKNLVRAYFEEAKWFHEGYVPSMEEYMRVALVTSAYKMLATTSFVGMGDLVTKEAFEWVSSDPLIVEAVSVICRLMDDMAGHKFEQERGHVASAVECYMKQHGATEEVVLLEFQKRVTNAWKDMNAECLRPTAVPMPLLTRVLNLAQVIDVIYKDEDTYTHSGTKLKNFVISVLIDSMPIN